MENMIAVRFMPKHYKKMINAKDWGALRAMNQSESVFTLQTFFPDTLYFSAFAGITDIFLHIFD